MINNFRTVSTFALLSFTAACSINNHEREPAEEPTGSRAQALTEEVEDASENPSGAIDAASIEGVLSAYAEIDFAIGESGMPCDLDPFDFEASGECSVNTSGDDVDVSCASSGSASGSMSVDVHTGEGGVYVSYQYDNVCAIERDVCVTGEGAVSVSSDGGVVVAGELTISRDGETSHIKYGVTVDTGVHVVVWVDGQSYVVSVDGSSDVDVEDASGGWTCDLAGELNVGSLEISGSCSLEDDEISF